MVLEVPGRIATKTQALVAGGSTMQKKAIVASVCQ